ncbi:50S ribosomal protein L24 [Bacteroidia bacterium]|nr:50S ribosomal protein L24 [Bacteroidia bacterium]GHU72637.1 50S ribosomal protein L24 [Bacteroidia bacterium]
MSKLHIKKGDTVYVNAGNDKGATGRVLKVYIDKQRALVEGINVVSKATKPNAKNPQGGFVKKEASVHISNLQLVDPSLKDDAGKYYHRSKGSKDVPVRIGRKLNAKGVLVRYSKKSGEEIK